MDIGLFEAKNRLSELVGMAERGEEVVITRRGAPVAKLVPVAPVYDRAAAQAAMNRIAARRDRMHPPVTLEEIMEWKNEGRVRRFSMSLVLDSSVTMAWIMKDEVTEAVQRIIARVVDDGAVVPSLWRLEVGNALQTSLRRGRIDAALRDANIVDLQFLRIEIDSATDEKAWSSTLRLSDRFRLTLYDAAYLELADRRGLPLATLDGELIAAATAMGVPLCG